MLSKKWSLTGFTQPPNTSLDILNLGRAGDARAADERALALAGNVAERPLLERRLADAVHAADTPPARPG